MMVLTIIIGLFAAGLVSYFATKINKTAGAVITIASTCAALILFLFAGSSDNALGVLSFNVTPLGWFCSVLILLIYSMVSFFHPYWMKKIMNSAAYNMLYLFSLAGIIGAFLAHDFIIFFIFWEIAVWSSTFIISFGKSRAAATVYFTMSVFASLIMLYAIFMLFAKFNSFEFKVVLSNLGSDPGLALTVFILMLLSGIVKSGIIPVHIWLPKAYSNAPDMFSPVLSGAISKLGAFLVILVTTAVTASDVWGAPLVSNIVLVLSAISIIVGTLMAIKQDDIKVLLAYSSVANAGYILMAILINDKIAMSGALVHIFAHGISAAAAFLAVAAVSYRTGTTKMSELGGLIHRMPVTFITFLVAILSIVGIPPTMGFISKWLLFQSLASNKLFFLASVAFFGSLGALLYAFRPLATVFLGQLKTKHFNVKEAPVGMLIPMVILSAIAVFFGVMPYGMIGYTAKIEEALGFNNLISTSGLVIQGNNGNLNPALITSVFGVGFIIALIIFFASLKSRKAALMDTYTAGEFIYTPDLYHYSYNFYAPMERLYEKHPDIVGLYEGLAQRIRDLGQLIKFLVFNSRPSQGVILIVLTIILLMWGGAQ